MTDSHNGAASHAAEHHGPNVRAYLMVFGALVICTLMSFVFNYGARADVINTYTSFTAIMTVSVIKATLVGTIFMHLKWDWGKVYIMIVPALILGPLLVVVLLPDIVLAWRTTTGAP
jgi:cytochrome c oxidase subunit IV